MHTSMVGTIALKITMNPISTSIGSFLFNLKGMQETNQWIGTIYGVILID